MPIRWTMDKTLFVRRHLMERKIVSQEELIQWMNQKLHVEQDSKDCRFTSVIKLFDKDEIGCNWSDPKLSCSGIPVEVCMESAGWIISEAKTLFNIK